MKLAIISTLLSALAIGGNALPLDSSDLATNADYSVGLDLFSDGDCKNQINAIKVGAFSCYVTHPGFSSMRVNNRFDSTGGTITAYTKADCGCPTCGSHGYALSDNGCLKNFGFTGNAIGFS